MNKDRQKIIEKLEFLEKIIQEKDLNTNTLKYIISRMFLYYYFILKGDSVESKLYDLDDCAHEIDDMLEQLQRIIDE